MGKSISKSIQSIVSKYYSNICRSFVYNSLQFPPYFLSSNELNRFDYKFIDFKLKEWSDIFKGLYFDFL